MHHASELYYVHKIETCWFNDKNNQSLGEKEHKQENPKAWDCARAGSVAKEIDWANEKGWRDELHKYLQERKLLQDASYLSFKLHNIPAVIPEEVELESLDRNDEITPVKQNIPGATAEKDERDGN